MAKDPKGRLLLGGQSGQPITRVTLDNGNVVQQEILNIPVSETMGMLFIDNVLYISGSGNKGFALYRCKDTKGNDSYDDVEFLREWQGGSGEHGSHGLVLGPDKMLYAVCGNFTGVPNDLATSSPHRSYGDDLALPRMEDGNGFGAGAKPPGGYVARMDLDGKNIELFSAGERNTYDIGFNADQPTSSTAYAAAITASAKGVQNGQNITRTDCLTRPPSGSGVPQVSFSVRMLSSQQNTKRRFTSATGPTVA
jgi:glucose/arabinose dehydrogenase